MAKHKGKSRYSGRWFFPRIKVNFALGTLGAKVLLSLGGAAAMVDRVWFSSMKATWSLTGYTPVAADGPITVGIAHSDYTDAEIEEWLEATTSMDFSDKIAQERAKRKCRIVGVFPAEALGEVLNDGRMIRTKAGWYLSSGEALNIWAFNEGTGALTTGASVGATGVMNLRLA